MGDRYRLSSFVIVTALAGKTLWNSWSRPWHLRWNFYDSPHISWVKLYFTSPGKEGGQNSSPFDWSFTNIQCFKKNYEFTLECRNQQVIEFALIGHFRTKHLFFNDDDNGKNALFKVCSIACYTLFPSFGQFVITTPVVIFSLLLRTIHRTVFSHLRTNRSVVQQVREVIDANKW